MTEVDWEFYEKQTKSSSIGCCDNFVDRKWEKSTERKQERAYRSKDESLDEAFYHPRQLGVRTLQVMKITMDLSQRRQNTRFFRSH